MSHHVQSAFSVDGIDIFSLRRKSFAIHFYGESLVMTAY